MGVQDMISTARQQIPNLSVAEVARELEDGGITLVDLRDADELRRDGHIPQALHAPRGMLEFLADPESSYHLTGLDPQRRTVLYCGLGGQSALASVTMRALGYTDIAHLDGGMAAWQDEGRPVTRLDPTG
ncbi:rhodanese-like domain-containing protein [Nakamurella deserti]|uniref:rhodanese-like domain-containing protein n=1 Tax=Nakamurella deserti TaxID=2164074 RepID=UPI000DBE78F1|nr:rhodanese-like domain-containing protein [Nakamurella deserti]